MCVESLCHTGDVSRLYPASRPVGAGDRPFMDMHMEGTLFPVFDQSEKAIGNSSRAAHFMISCVV